MTRLDADETPRPKAAGYGLSFDVVRRFAQPLGIHLDAWETRVIETRKGVVRLLAVMERGQKLFGESGAGALADDIASGAASSPQFSLFPEAPPAVRGRAAITAGAPRVPSEATTLDRVHVAMLLQANGHAAALRKWIVDEQERGPDFLRLANALSRPVPARQPGEASAGRHAAGGAEVTCSLRPCLDRKPAGGSTMTAANKLLERITSRPDVFV